MKCCGIEIRTVRPHERMDFAIKAHLREQLGILKRSVQLPDEDRREIDRLPRAVGEFDAQCVRTDALERDHPMDWV